MRSALVAIGVCAVSSAAGAPIISALEREDLEQRSQLQAEVSSEITTWLESGKDSPPTELLQKATAAADPYKVAEGLAERLPPDVQAWVEAGKEHSITAATTTGPFSEASLNKARKKLNGMIESAQKELDIRMVECKEFKEKNRGTMRQVNADLARLGETIAGAKGRIAKAHSGIEDSLGEIDELQGMLNEHDGECETVRVANQKQLDILKDDLAVCAFIVKMTECKGFFVQSEAQQGGLQSCLMNDGSEEFYFADSQLAGNVAGLHTEHARTIVQGALKSTAAEQQVTYEAKRSLGMLVTTTSRRKTTVVDVNGANPTKDAAKAKADKAARAVKRKAVEKAMAPKPNKKKQMNKCVLGKPNCGLLNDNMSLMWGEVKDSVEELEAVMNQNAQQCKRIRDDFNIEISTWQTSLNNFNVELAEGTAELNEDEEEQREKLSDERQLQKEYERVWGQCVEDIHEILFTNICGVKSVRGEIAKFSTGSMKPTDIRDCEVTDFAASECSKECMGGVQTLSRYTVQKRNLGAKCPVFTMKKKCNEFPCPVHCLMRSWSRWGKCSKECGGGLEQRVRAVSRKPNHGGGACGATQDERQCNVDSCDVDCRLRKWTRWAACSRGCGGGIKERVRKLRSRARGEGKCANRKSSRRYRRARCNTKKCKPNPWCVATQDIVFVVDASGSFKNPDRFNVMKKLMTEMVDMYSLKAGNSGAPGKAPIRGHATMGIVQFSKTAKIVLPMTEDKAAVTAGIGKLTYAKGITDMAMGLTMASTVLLEGRKAAQSVVMVLTDGKPSFQYATRIAANKLKREGSRLVFVAINTYGDLKFMKKLSSFPSRDNVIHVNGLKKLFKDTKKEASRIVASTCSWLRFKRKAPAAKKGAPKK